jgi:hypothetical protein
MFWTLDIGIWNLLGICDLWFGAYPCGAKRVRGTWGLEIGAWKL